MAVEALLSTRPTRDILVLGTQNVMPLVHEWFGHMRGQNVPMDYFAFFLSRGLDLNVIDKTGLTNRYDVDFHYVPDLPARPDGGPALVNGQPVAADGPDLFTALRQQLGLRLEKGRGPVDFLVIDHVEKPSEN